MVLPHRISTFYTVILLLLLHASLEAKKPKKELCPIGFNIVYPKGSDHAETLCYRLKGPENFTDTFKDCSGNLYTTQLYDRLGISNTHQILWTDYKSAYPGGPFIDTSFTSSAGSLLDSSFDIANVQRQFQDELCVVKEPSGNYTAVRCNGEYYRYCVIETFSDTLDSTEDCETLKGSRRFWSPRPVCLIALSAVGGGTVRATWSQSKNLCESRGGEILYNGWRYSNYPELHTSESHVYPLRVTYDPSHSNTVRNGAEFMRQPPFVDTYNTTNEVSFGALNNSKWAMVNTSYIFYNVICEKDVELKEIILSIQVDKGNKLTLTVNYNISDIYEYIYCYTDSKTYYPTEVDITSESTNSYILKPENDGNYWCISIESKQYKASLSEKVLWIREKQSLENTYAVKLYFGRPYDFNNVKDISDTWKKILKEYIYYSTEFSKTQVAYIEDPKAFENTLKDFKTVNPELSPKGDIIYNMRIKRIYLDRRTALVHLQLNPTMKPVRVGWWSNLRVFYMKPVRTCTVDDQKFDSGESVHKNCAVHKCVGDFIEGVQVVTEIDKNCENLTSGVVPRNAQVTVSMPVVATTTEENIFMRNETYIEDSSSSEETIVTTEFITESTVMSYIPQTTTLRPPTITSTTPSLATETVITAVPEFPTELTEYTTLSTTTTEIVELAPEEQLQQVMEDLEQLLSNTSVMLPLEVISQPFQDVDSLLSKNMSLEIPSQLLHLLDELGARVDLNGSEAQRVGDNLALLIATADYGNPVHGLRIVARDSNTFSDDDFEIIRDQVNSSHLLSRDSEAVVQLPSSAANSSRISFVVFRNDRAFQTNSSLMTVNSKVLSINVQNVTRFENHETVDIHFSPIVGNLERNQSRSCAYWHFDEYESGSWSEEGCKFVAATEEGMLDTCRCTHLTHFAEILVSRELFSELDEKILEYISVTGCCLSLLGLIIIAITAILFRSWRRDFNNKIWFQLCIAITLLITCFLIATFAKFSTYTVACAMTGITLHYSVLASFCWMLVAAIISYRRLVMVFTRDASHKLLKAAAFAWGTPFAIVGILLSVNPRAYDQHFEYKAATSTFCYPSGLSIWLTIYAPIAIMLLINWTLFVLIVRSVFASRGIQRHGDSNEALRCASVSCLLVFLFGLPWIFGLFAYNVVAAYFFALTATLQGFVLFIFFVVGNKKTRDLWLNKLKIKQTRKVPVTSSTYTNRSTTGVGWRGDAPANVAAKASKPRSLTSPDDSRFS